MATRSRELVLDSFNSVSGGQRTSDDPVSGTVSSLASTLNELTRQADRLITGAGEWGGTGVGPEPAERGSSSSGGGGPYTIDVSAQSGSRLNTGPTLESVGQATASSGSGSSALSIASTIFESGLGIVPLVSGLLGLFGGGASTSQPLERYIMPDRLQFTGADTSGGIGDADYDQFGMPRLYGGMSSAMTTSVNPGGLSAASGGNPSGGSSQINVTVQAMDSQSFLDHSNEIAQAVRHAMLNLNSINDVMSDL